ncbi:hypothetical protein BH10BAC5_BH10BAC5_23490 [soil metagenome]
MENDNENSHEIKPWHGINEDVYHSHIDCTSGSNIESEHVRSGSGERPHCPECEKLQSSNLSAEN